MNTYKLVNLMGFHIPKILKHFVKHRPLRAGSYAIDFQTQIVCALNKKTESELEISFFDFVPKHF